MHKYAVDEFVDEGSVDVVAMSWIFSKDGFTFCHWPLAFACSAPQYSATT